MKKPGRKPMGDLALTPTEKTQRQRVKNKFRLQSAKNHGYVPVTVLMSSKQIESITGFLSLIDPDETTVPLDNTTINDTVYKGLMMLLAYYEIEANKQGHSAESINKCKYSDKNDYLNYLLIEIEAQKALKAWELSNTKEKQ